MQLSHVRHALSVPSVSASPGAHVTEKNSSAAHEVQVEISPAAPVVAALPKLHVTEM